MANHKSAEKCIRKIARRTLINKARMSRIRTFVRKFEEAATQPNIDITQKKEALVAAERELMRGVNKGVLHKNTAARKVSRLTKRLKALSA